MRFLSVRGRGFARFVEPFELNLERRGLVLVEGRNHDSGDAFDSNAAGKSMLFAAIEWCLFGKMSRYGNERLSSEEVCYENRSALVTVEFETSRGRFHAIRQREPTAFLLETWDGATWTPLRGQSRAAALDDVTMLLGFDYQTFRTALFLQGTAMDVAKSGFTSQMRMLESILRFDVFTQAAKIASDRQKALEAESRDAVNEIERQSLIMSQAQSTLAEIERLDESAREDELNAGIAQMTEQIVVLPDVQRRDVEWTEKQSQTQQKFGEAIAAEKQMREQLARIDLLLRQGDDGILSCPTCQQPVSRETASELYVATEEHLAAKRIAVDQRAKEKSACTAYLSGVQKTLASLRDVERNLKNAQRELADLQTRKTKHLAMIESQTRVKDAAEQRVAELTENVAETRRHAQIAQFWARGFGGDGLKGEVLGAAAPVLNGAALRYSDLLTDGVIRVEFVPSRETRSENLIRVHGASAPTYDGCSAGERRRIDLIVSLSLRALARWRLAEPINMALWDEVLDPLDESGLRRALGILQQDMDELESVFLITHNPALKAMFPSANMLCVEREHGQSRVIE